MLSIAEKEFSFIHEEVSRLQRPKGCFKYLLSRNNTKLLQWAKLVERSLQGIEESGVLVFNPESTPRSAASYKQQLNTAWKTAITLRDAIFKVSVRPSMELIMKGGELQRLVVGNQYAAGAQNGGMDPLQEPDSNAIAFLHEITVSWKSTEALATSRQLNRLEIQQLQEAARYKEWVKVLMSNPWLRKPFLHFCLRDFNPVWVFICYPATADRLKKALLSAQIGYVRRLDREAFLVEVRPDGPQRQKKVLTLPIYQGSDFSRFQPELQQRVNILDMRERIHFISGNVKTTVGEIFHESGERNRREVQINFSAFGFVNFHPHYGVWSQIQKKFITRFTTHRDLDWLHQIPPTRLVAHRELVMRYGAEKIRERQFFYKVMSTRQKTDLTGLKSHAFLQIWLRTAELQEWKVLDIGYYAERFQTGVLDGLSMMCGTLPGRVSLIDQNGYYSYRQRAEVVCFPEETEFRALSYKLLQQTITPRVFQFTGRNCAYSLQKLVQKASGRSVNYFRIPVENAKVGIEVLDQLLHLSGRIHRFLRKMLYYTLKKLLLENRGISIQKKGREKKYSLSEFSKKKGDVLFSPPVLHEQILQGKLEGVIYFGHAQE